MTETTENTDRFPEERDWLEGIGRGDQRAFAHLVHAYWSTVYSLSLAYLKSAQRAEEVTQDIFLKLWTTREKLREVQRIENYIFIVARNHVLNETRKRIQTIYGYPEESTPAAQPTPDLLAEYKDTYQLLLKGIELLPEKRREVFRLSRLDGMSNERIAAVLGIHKDTVYQYLVKAVLFLRTYIREQSENNFFWLYSISLLLLCL